LTSKSQPQWCNSLNVVCGNNEETLLLGVSSLRMACNSTKCEYLEARSNLLIIDFAGNILGEVKSSDKDQFISYGRIQKVATTYCIPRDVDLFGRAKVANSKACLINPETGLISNIENYNLLWDWNKNHFFYSPDDKHFFVK
jgi:hypothetical protein